ncbi:radical SAM protein [bacterium]|nr:radical SAM protein [bacterium]
MPKMVFIEPKSSNIHIFSKFPLPRLGSFVLGTLMKNRGWDVDIVVEAQFPIRFDSLYDADLVGISTITATAPRAYAIADRIRSMNIPVMMGGPHVTYLTDEALEHADYVIRGEGEAPLAAFAACWEKGLPFDTVPGLSFVREGRIVHNPQSGLCRDLDAIPFPDFSLLKGQIRKIARHRIVPVQTSRGCPFNCSFCSVTGMFGKQYRYRSTENIIEELRQYNARGNYVFFYDDNFTANRKRARDLLEAMIREKFRFKWSTQVRVDVAADAELVRLMKKAGCHTLFIGMESVNPESLKAMKKSQTVEDIVRAVRILKKARIHVHGMFVFGFDEDDSRTVKETVKFARRSGLTSSQFLILTPLPGSEFYEKMVQEGRIQFRDWSLYDAHHVVFRPSRFSFKGLQWAQIVSHDRFYSKLEMIRRFLRGKWFDLGLAHMARDLNRSWKRKNKTFLKVVDLLTPGKNADIEVQYREKVSI